MLRLGFVGTGAITEAVVHGLHRADNRKVEILLSPRSEARSRALAARYQSVTRAHDNAAVVAGSDVVFLAVRPQQLPDIVGLPFRSDQSVVSFLAGTPIDRIRAFAAPAARLTRVLPLPCISVGQGPILITPPDPTLKALFAGLGDLISLEHEADFGALAAITGLISSHFELQNVVFEWLRAQNVSDVTASLYVRSFFAGLGASALAAAHDDHTSTGQAIEVAACETPGGLNEACRMHLTDRGWFGQFGEALAAIQRRARELSESTTGPE